MSHQTLGDQSVFLELAKPGTSWLALDFNEWAPHVLSSLEILTQAKHRGCRSTYLNLAAAQGVGYGQLIRGMSSLSVTSQVPAAVLRLARANDVSISSPLRMPRDDSPENDLMLVRGQMLGARDLGDLLKITWRGLPIGFPVVSSAMSEFERYPLTFPVLRRLAWRNAQAYARTHRLVSRLLASLRPDVVVIFNGRFVHEHAASRVAVSVDVPLIFHDVSAEPDSIYVSRAPVHDIAAFAGEAERAWHVAADTDRLAVAQRWIDRRLQRDASDVARFARRWGAQTQASETNLGPSETTQRGADGQLAAIFPTSDHEFVAVSDDWTLPDCKTQREWLSEVATTLSQANHRVVIRLHPNLQRVPKSVWKDWLELESARVHVIQPDAPIDSYALVRRADTVITCGSTMGVEADFLGRRSVSVGPSIYEGLKAIPRAMTVRECLDLVEAPTPVSAGPSLGTLQYAYFMTERDCTREFFPDSVWPRTNSLLDSLIGRPSRIVARGIARVAPHMAS